MGAVSSFRVSVASYPVIVPPARDLRFTFAHHTHANVTTEEQIRSQPRKTGVSGVSYDLQLTAVSATVVESNHRDLQPNLIGGLRAISVPYQQLQSAAT